MIILTFIVFISTTSWMTSSTSSMNCYLRRHYNLKTSRMSMKPLFFIKFQQFSHVLVIGISSLKKEVFAFAQQVNDDDDTHDDYLAEILAEEQREAEELAKLEAQMKELDQMKMQQEQMKQERHKDMNMPSGSAKMSGSGARNKDLDNIQEELRKKEAMAQEKKKEAFAKEHAAAKEEAKKERAEKIAKERDAAFQAEIERARDEKTRKNLKRQKAKDANIVKKILNNGKQGNHYAVLGMRCQWGEIQLGPLKFCSVKNSEIKRAYRKIAKLVHPDKNRDGLAEQAFDLLEKSSAILLDEKQRKEYDVKLKLQRKDRFQSGVRTVDDTWNALVKVLTTLKKVLGPFATPIFILTALII